LTTKTNKSAVLSPDPAGARPLAGKRIIITRARSQTSRLARLIADAGGEIIEFPTIEIQPPESFAGLDAAIERITGYDWVIFTSVNGVEAFRNRIVALGKSMTDLEAIKIGAIGPETAKRVTAAGLQAALVPQRYQAEGILDLLNPEIMRGKKVLIPRAAKAREILPETLRHWGAQVDVVEAYRTVMPAKNNSALRDLLGQGKIDMITFTSSSTVTNFSLLFDRQKLASILDGIAIACIGPITRQTVEDLGGRADIVSERFTIPGLAQAIVDYFGGRTSSGRSAKAKSPAA
jgi:uroporphyrinogen III methyltransferase/synthase